MKKAKKILGIILTASLVIGYTCFCDIIMEGEINWLHVFECLRFILLLFAAIIVLVMLFMYLFE